MTEEARAVVRLKELERIRQTRATFLLQTDNA
jgi:hypothetical protein